VQLRVRTLLACFAFGKASLFELVLCSFAFELLYREQRISQSRDGCRPRSAFRSQLDARLPSPRGPLFQTNRSVRSFC